MRIMADKITKFLGTDLGKATGEEMVSSLLWQCVQDTRFAICSLTSFFILISYGPWQMCAKQVQMSECPCPAH